MKSQNARIILLSVLLAILIGCAKTVNVQPVESASKSAIAIRIHVPIQISWNSRSYLSPKYIYFIKLNDEKDSIRKADLIPSNYIIMSIGRYPRAFLLNVEPGTYAVVGAIGVCKGMGSATAEVFTYFPEDMIKKTIVRIEPNSFYYAGTFAFETGSEMYRTQPDETQNYYYRTMLLGNHKEVAGKQKISWIKSPQYIPLVLKKSENSKSDEIEFLKDHLDVFKGTGWDVKIQNRLNKIEKLEK